MNEARLVLHIGLPKTASTFLQYAIFKHAPDLIYVQRGQPLAKLMKKYTRLAEEDVGDAQAAANAELAKVYEKRRNQRRRAEGRDTLISHENISMGGTREWESSGPTPSLVAARTAAWAQSEDLPHRSIAVILGVRRHDQWLASRYAQSGDRFAEAGQADFERRVRGLCAGELFGWWQWLDYAESRRKFVGALGPDNVFVFSMEALAATPHEVLGGMGDFLGGVPLADIYRRVEEDPEGRTRRNVKSTGPNTWKLRETETSIRLTDSVSDEVRERFRSSNEKLSEAIGVDLGSLGYW